MPLTRSQQNPPSLMPPTDAGTTGERTSQQQSGTDTPQQPALDHDANASPRPRASARIPDNAVPYFKSARRCLQGLLRSQHHAEYLKFCIDTNTTPRGLQAHIPPTIPEPDYNFVIEWEQAHHQFARQLTLLLLDYYRDRATRLQGQVDRSNEFIQQICTPEIASHIGNLLETVRTNLTTELTARRTRKITRDTGASNDTT